MREAHQIPGENPSQRYLSDTLPNRVKTTQKHPRCKDTRLLEFSAIQKEEYASQADGAERSRGTRGPFLDMLLPTGNIWSDIVPSEFLLSAVAGKSGLRNKAWLLLGC